MKKFIELTKLRIFAAIVTSIFVLAILLIVDKEDNFNNLKGNVYKNYRTF